MKTSKKKAAKKAVKKTKNQKQKKAAGKKEFNFQTGILIFGGKKYAIGDFMVQTQKDATILVPSEFTEIQTVDHAAVKLAANEREQDAQMGLGV